MKIKLHVPVVFHAPVTKSSGLRSVLTFVESEIDLQEATWREAPLAVSHVLRPNVLVREYRLHDGRLLSAIRRPNANPDPTDPLVSFAFQIEQDMAKAALDELREVGLANVHPRDAIDMLDRFIKADSSGNSISARREQYLTAVKEKTENTRIRNLVSASEDFDAMRASSIARAAALVDNNVLVDGKAFKTSPGLTIRVQKWGQKVLVNEGDISALNIGSNDGWETPLGQMGHGSLNAEAHFFGGTDMEEAVRFAQDMAIAKNIPLEINGTRQPEYLVPRDMVPSIDMRYPEVVRAAKAVAFVVGSEIARRFKNREFAIFDDDPAIRYAFDGLRDRLVRADPFGEPDDRIETTLANLLATLRERPVGTNAIYRNILGRRRDVFEFAYTALARWEERPMEVRFEHSLVSATRP